MGVIINTTLAISIATISAGFAYYFYQLKKKVKVPGKWTEIGIVKKLCIYPLKSGNRIEVSKAECTEVGLRQCKDDDPTYQLRDRGLIVYGDKDHEFRTARTYPKMVLIDVGVHDEDHLSIDAPTMRTLYVKIPKKTDDNTLKIKCHKGEEIIGIDCGEEAASWFSRYILGKSTGLALAYHDASSRRDITRTHKQLLDYYLNLTNDSTGLYSDLSSVLIVNQQSVNDLNKKIGSGTHVSVNNFRPNLVVDGTQIQPYAEDEWDWVKVGDVLFRKVKECTRCILTTVDPETATRSTDREPLKTLETYRMSDGPAKLPVMGINTEVKRNGVIHVGDTVYFAKDAE
ncbi:mitochondrial amidoxime-reducing component 1 isoform X2 [Aethina tumida]|uniref:mitochondrial amidoxime-reducing component 1 isoform X1 n=1 Tax=Aethina tumida TaxID=116153 RepID=UPI00096AE853|nr:mitochondrial amidoxime-reducing component 1 isoform X1 [Aethina tumida]XP_049825639.1 mitochondrial amidoxime-reducing component 1 isoform X2 [Aethina tumida]